MNFEQPDLWKIMFLHMAGGLDLMIIKCPFQPKIILQICDSMNFTLSMNSEDLNFYYCLRCSVSYEQLLDILGR